MRLHTIRQRVTQALGTQTGKRLIRLLRWGFIGGLTLLLVQQLAEIGWHQIGVALPRTPWFYLLFLLAYLQLTIVEAVLYSHLLDLKIWQSLPALFRKRLLNNDVVNYAGEVYFYLWAKDRAPVPASQVWRVMKDNALTTAVAGFLASATLLLGGVLTRQIVLPDVFENLNHAYAFLGVLLLVVLMGLRFRKRIFTVSGRMMWAMMGLHYGRLLLVYVVRILQWWVVWPQAPLSVWATMLAVMTITNRLPLLPAKNLLSMGAILGMSGALAAPQAVLAGMLVAQTALEKILDLGFFLFAGPMDKNAAVLNVQKQAPPEPETPVASDGYALSDEPAINT
jgi:hypothetical protein